MTLTSTPGKGGPTVPTLSSIGSSWRVCVIRGEASGLTLFGTYAMNSLRMEKAYRGWGSELTNEIDMFEGSMERVIRLDKEEFIGRQASLGHKQRGARIKLVYLEIEAKDSDGAIKLKGSRRRRVFAGADRGLSEGRIKWMPCRETGGWNSHRVSGRFGWSCSPSAMPRAIR